MTDSTRPAFNLRSIPPLLLGVLAVLAAVITWAYWSTFTGMAERWASDPQYSHGYLVPLFSLVLLYLRRSQFDLSQCRTSYWGLLLVLASLGVRLVGALNFDWLDGASLIVALAGLCLLLGGWTALRWALPSILFLVFMLPLPYRVEHSLSRPLQSVATACSTYIFQTIGIPAVAEGNVIHLTRGRIGVVEACSGLSMVLVFAALAVALILVVKRPWLDKALILLAAFPIAVAANVIRITITGLAQEWISPEAAESIFHDWAGWMMMPIDGLTSGRASFLSSPSCRL